MTRPLPLTEGRLLLVLNECIDRVAPPDEALTGYSEQTLMRIQDAINTYFDQARGALILAAQEAQKPS